jgi:hypothetical protein
MSRLVNSLLVIVGLGVAAALLNPSAERHRGKIKEAIGERSAIQKYLGVGQLTAFASTYHSFGLGSYTTVNDKLVSVGAFGMVFVTE